MRLIDADKYKGKVISRHCYSGVIKLINVDDVPTAFDIDKVIEQLENKADSLDNDREKVLLDEVIKIIKAGSNINPQSMDAN